MNTEKWDRIKRDRGGIPEAVCEGKHRFDTRADASQAMPNYKRSGQKSGMIVKPYRCNFCAGWHLGSTSKRVG